ncbi:MAG: EAL domain-containing protein [Treponema sp.]|nr:EAL domain-containing protein [Treponema sp.]
MGYLEKVKRFLGIQNYSDYVKDYFYHSNIIASIYVCSVVLILEIWMILSTLFTQMNKRTTSWLIIHLACYFALFLSALLLLVYAYLHHKKVVKNRKGWEFLRLTFCTVSMAFGIYISYMDYLKGEQFITLMTMTIFVFCFIVWRPIFSICFLTFSYGIFFVLCNYSNPASYATKVNLTIVLISILLSAINAFRQKIKEAQKEEKLEHAHNILLKLAISDEVTGIANINYFRGQALEIMQKKETNISNLVFLFLDVENFKILNQKYGFIEGNMFLKKFADVLNQVFYGDLIAHFSNDNFVILAKDLKIKDKILDLCKKLQDFNYDIKLGLKVGAYKPESKDCLPFVACDHARFACNSIKKHYSKTYCEYDKTMSNNFQKKQYILNNFDKAIENEYIKVYYQPIVNAKTGKICSLEALARWDDPFYGFLSPADFIETLEEYYQIHRLDMYVVEQVCRNISNAKKIGKKILPISLNFSRLDFGSLNLAEEVEACLNKYEINKQEIHIEITESTLSENDEKLKTELKQFRNAGYALWLDDFGSGYSGLNVLKEYEFDVMKIDMKFLSNFEGNQKARQILKNIITLANELGMKTLTEGVETQEAYNFLKQNDCELLQGYLFSKPLPLSDLQAKLDDGTFLIE